MSYVARVTLTGQTPLLMHADDVMASDELSEWRKNPANKNFSTPGDDRSPAWTWSKYLYTDGVSHLAIPIEMVMAGLRTAGAQIILKKQKTFKEITQSGIQPDKPFFEFKCGLSLNSMQSVSIKSVVDVADSGHTNFREQFEAVKKTGFQLFVKRARVGSAKHVRVRPRFEFWQATGDLHVVADEIAPEKLTELFAIFGRGGIGDWRAACRTPGPWGRCKATWEQLKAA